MVDYIREKSAESQLAEAGLREEEDVFAPVLDSFKNRWAWLAVNLLIGLIGSSLVPGAQGMGIAWEAHVAGFVAGVLAISPVTWLARRI